MKNKILPSWFWQLLPVLTQRQTLADFETWLYSEIAETILPNEVYTALFWLNYHQDNVLNDVLHTVIETGHLSDKKSTIQVLIRCFQTDLSELRLDEIDDFCQHALPLSSEWCDALYSFLYDFWRLCLEFNDSFSLEEKQTYQHTVYHFMTELHDYLIYQTTPLPDVPDMSAFWQVYQNRHLTLWQRMKRFFL